MEKTPAPTLHYNRVLPDYFCVVQNIDEVYSSVNAAAEVSSENVPETPPPRYEEAIEMTTLALLTAAANQMDTFSSMQYAFTQETMDISDEIFVYLDLRLEPLRQVAFLAASNQDGFTSF